MLSHNNIKKDVNYIIMASLASEYILCMHFVYDKQFSGWQWMNHLF